MERIVIVGASLAGARAAAVLRDEGWDGNVLLIGAEGQLPYNRPPLSKGYLRGEDRFEDQLINTAAFYQERRIELRLGVRATAIDPLRKLSSWSRRSRVVRSLARGHRRTEQAASHAGR
jgi:3-phenylpropionate/trans-cinnamate dioxygenase ferredoxin reductase subunit